MCDTLLKKLFSIILISGALYLSSCKKEYADGIDRSTYTLSLNSSGSQQIPVSSAHSAFSGTYNAGTNVLEYKITWSGLASPATNVFFHGPVGQGEMGAVDLYSLSITVLGVNGEASGKISISEVQEEGLLTGKWIYNIQNATYLRGEIQGQIAASPY
jgi:CHRD domain